MGGGVPTDPQTGQRNQSQQLLGPGNIPSFQPNRQLAQKNKRLFDQVLGDTYRDTRHLNQSRGYNVLGHFTDPNFSDNLFAERFRLDASRQDEPVEDVASVSTEDEIAERQARLDERIQAGADRYKAAQIPLGYGPVGPRYGQTSDGTQLFPGSTPTPISEIPAWAGLRSGPAKQAIGVGLEQTQPDTGSTPVSLLERVTGIAEQIRPSEQTQTAAQGGLVGRYDLGGLVNSMLLQASRSTDNIPTNMVR
tara:strand:- start:1026 stop:1775 length:750 start_codon:yes stop_codon:yes gene_type:complete